MANLDHVLILPGEAVFAAGRYRRVSHERPGSRTPRPADDAPGSAWGKGRDTRPMSISGPNANTAVSPAPARRRAAPGTFRLSEGKRRGAARAPAALRTAGGIEALIARQRLENRPSGASRGQARPSRARCARRVQDRPARRHSVPGRAQASPSPSPAASRAARGTMASMACSARSSSGSRSRSPRWRRASACSGEVQTGFPNRTCAKSTNPGLTRKDRETGFAGAWSGGRADRLRAISSHCTETRVCHNSDIVRERAGRYKLAPRARGFA
jgi:hypothetical protein